MWLWRSHDTPCRQPPPAVPVNAFLLFCFLFIETTELLLALSSVRSAKRRVVLTRKSSVFASSTHKFLKSYFGPQNFVPPFNCAPPSFLISCKLSNLFNLVLFINFHQINSIKPLLINFSN